MATKAPHKLEDKRLGALASLIFATHWLQLPLQLGLIVAYADRLMSRTLKPAY